MSAAPMTGQQALAALVDARAMERAVQALKERGRSLLEKLDAAAIDADWHASQALRRVDELAQTDPGQLGFKRTSEACWLMILRATQQTTDLEADTGRLLERRNGEASA